MLRQEQPRTVGARNRMLGQELASCFQSQEASEARNIADGIRAMRGRIVIEVCQDSALAWRAEAIGGKLEVIGGC